MNIYYIWQVNLLFILLTLLNNLQSINENYKNIINFFILRKIMKELLENICKTSGINKHTSDYAIKHCVEMYK
jgi:hypothetical protein